MDICREVEPEFLTYEGTHQAACHRAAAEVREKETRLG
jgi:hypothetical protein